MLNTQSVKCVTPLPGSLPGTADEGFFVVNDYAVIVVYSDVAPVSVVAEGLVDPHPRGTHQPTEVRLGEAQGSEGSPAA